MEYTKKIMEYTKTLTAIALCFVLLGCGGDESGSGVEANITPTISGTPETHITVGQSYQFIPTFSDPNDDSLTFSIENKPSWAEFDITTGVLSGTPEQAATTENIVISISDGEFTVSLTAFSLIVYNHESDELFDLNVLHKYRITITMEEWDAFVLDTKRARYDNRDSGDNEKSNLWTHSEIYRKVNVERVDTSTNEVFDTLDNVGFKMRGNNSRQWPEHWIRYEDSTPDEGQPNRFHFSLKFSEKFDEDESVYACIDSTGSPAAVSGNPCWERVSLNHPEVPENDDRNLKGLEKLTFKFNKDDPSYARELLSHDILTQIGVPTSRMAYANIELVITGGADQQLFNNSLPQTYNMGVYMVEEPIDKPYLKRNFGENGYLFKVGGGDLNETVDKTCLPYEDDDKANTGYINDDFCRIGVEKSDPNSREEWLGIDNYLDPIFVNSDINNGDEVSQFAPYRPTYDLKEKKKSIVEARSALQDFMLFLQGNPTAVELNEQFDVAGFIKAQAADITLGAADHYARVGNNYYLYLNPTTDKWQYLVYDYDFTFRDRHPDYWGDSSTNFQDIADTKMFSDDGETAWNEGTSDWIDPLLWTITFSNSENKNILYQEVKNILTNQLDWDNILENVLTIRNNLIKDTILDASISIKDECDTDYNETALGLTTHTPCDTGDISIKDYIEWRQRVLTEELEAAGF